MIIFAFLSQIIWLCHFFVVSLQSKSVNMKNRGTIYNLIWLDRGETDPERYEYFTCPSAIYEKYDAKCIGIAKGSLLNAMGKLDDDGKPMIFTPSKNPHLRIVKSFMYGKDASDNDN